MDISWSLWVALSISIHFQYTPLMIKAYFKVLECNWNLNEIPGSVFGATAKYLEKKHWWNWVNFSSLNRRNYIDLQLLGPSPDFARFCACDTIMIPFTIQVKTWDTSGVLGVIPQSKSIFFWGGTQLDLGVCWDFGFDYGLTTIYLQQEIFNVLPQTSRKLMIRENWKPGETFHTTSSSLHCHVVTT